MEMPMGPISGVNGAEIGFVFWEVVCLQRGLGSFCQKRCCGGACAREPGEGAARALSASPLCRGPERAERRSGDLCRGISEMAIALGCDRGLAVERCGPISLTGPAGACYILLHSAVFAPCLCDAGASPRLVNPTPLDWRPVSRLPLLRFAALDHSL